VPTKSVAAREWWARFEAGQEFLAAGLIEVRFGA
jgi:hypothetical protein